MKTSFDISEPLLLEIKALARERGTTTRSLVEQALVKLLDEARQPASYRLPDVTYGSGGFTPEFENASWAHLREASYPIPPLRTSASV